MPNERPEMPRLVNTFHSFISDKLILGMDLYLFENQLSKFWSMGILISGTGNRGTINAINGGLREKVKNYR